LIIEVKTGGEQWLEKKLGEGNWDIVEMAWSGRVDMDVTPLVGGKDASRPVQPHVDQALDAMAAAWDPAERGKLARQLAVGASVEGEPIVTCAVEVHTATATYVLPRRAPRPGEPVSEWLARATLEEMRNVIASFGQERFARRIAAAIERARARAPLQRTAQLAALIERAVPSREPGKHPATRTFQALRMMINDELGQLQRALTQSLTLLSPGGRLAVISFHSLEDGVVRDFFAEHSSIDPALARLPLIPERALPRLKRIGRKQRASAAEVAANPRARSALLRVAEYIGPVAA